MQIVVYGAGAVGSFIGASLHEQGVSVRLIGRPGHVEAIRSRGLRLDRRQDTRVVQLPAHTNLEGPADIILLTVKSQDVAAACREIARASLGATIVTMQNGVRCDQEAASILGRDRIVGCVIYLSVTYLEDGVVQQNTVGRLLAGAPYPEGTAREPAVIELLRRVLPTQAVPDLARARWTKLMPNLGNAIMAITGLPVSRAYRNPALNRLAIDAMREGVLTARAAGHQLDGSPLARRFRLMATLPRGLSHAVFRRGLERSFPVDSNFGSSTQQSLQRGSGSELNYLNGEIVRAGRDASIPTPINAALLTTGEEVFRTRSFLNPDELAAAAPYG